MLHILQNYGEILRTIWLDSSVLRSEVSFGHFGTGAEMSRHFRGLIYKISYDNLTIMPKLRPTYDGRLIHKTAYNEWKAFHR